MRPIRILQLASFRGNIGDNANVVGTRRLLRENLAARGPGADASHCPVGSGDRGGGVRAAAAPAPLAFTDLEYLEYEPDPRWGGRKFDDSFVRLANEHDLVLIGGGGFFELGVDASATGTPIDITIERLAAIRPPVVFHALGFDLSYGVVPQRVEKFGRFLRHVLADRRRLVSVRNDGSRENLRRALGEEIAAAVDVIPDGGFFTTTRDSSHVELPDKATVIALNLAGDRLAFRFGDVRGSQSNLDAFLARLAAVLRRWLERCAAGHIVLVPHIPEDLYVIERFMRRMGPPFVRRRMTVAPYIHGAPAQDYVFDLYAKSALSVGMRFHANVCSIGLGTPSIGLVTHPQIAALYGEIGLPERALAVADADFAARLEALIESSLCQREAIRARYACICAELRRQVDRFHARIGALLAR